MPVYEHVCSNCGLKFEQLRPLSKAGGTVPCSRCHKDAEQVFSPFASFTKDSSGLTTPTSGGSSCSSCSSGNCNTCGL